MSTLTLAVYTVRWKEERTEIGLREQSKVEVIIEDDSRPVLW
jgi:hypothetical protein